MNGLILRVTYEGVRYDLDTFEDIAFRVDISTIQNNEIGSTFGVASQAVTLPGSSNNNKFFVAAYNVNSPNARGFKQSVPCQVLQNGAEVFNGNLILNDVVTDTYNDTVYNITLVNETIDFANLISEQYLNELDFSDLDHAYTPANVTESFNDDDSFLNGDVFYPLVEYGLDGTVPDMYSIQMGGGTGKVDNASTPMLLQQFKPAIRVKSVIDRIFDSVNYEYSSSFFESDEFKSMYLITTNSDKNGIVLDSSTDSGFRADGGNVQTLTGSPSSAGTIEFVTEIYDPLSSYNPTLSEFTVVSDGQYAFSANIPFTKASAGFGGISQLSITLDVNGINAASQFYNLLNQTNGTIGFSTAAINLTAGDVVKLEFFYSGQDQFGSSVDLILTAPRQFNTLFSPIAIIGSNVDMSQQFDPKIKSLDLLKGIIEKFNLVLEPKKNERNVLIVEPFDDWADAGAIKDWSDKYDRAEKISVKHPIQTQPLNIKFEDSFDTDVLTQWAKDNFDDERAYGSYRYTATSDVPKGERKVGGFFSPIPTKGIPGAPSMILPLLYKSDPASAKAYKFKPRLAYRIDNQGAVGANNGEFFLKDPLGGGNLSIRNYSTLSSLQQYPANNCNSIHFNGQWYPFHQPVADGFTPFGTFNQYWSRYINELYADEARLLTLNMNFKPTDLIDIQLNDKIFIDNAYYRINKISGFNITNDDTVKVELLKAPLRKIKYARRTIWNTDDVIGGEGRGPADVYNGPSDFEPRGTVVVRNVEDDTVVTDEKVLKRFASLEGYRFISGSVYWKSEFNQNNLDPVSEQAVRGSVVVDSTAGVVIGAADSGSIGQNVDKAVVIGTGINIEREVRNSFVSGDVITVGSGSDNVAVFSSVKSTIGPGTEDSTLLSSSGSFTNGSLNTQIGTEGSNIRNGALQSTLIGTTGITLDNNNNTFERHTHIGGNKFEYYNTGSSETFINSVGLGQLPDVPTNEGVDKINKVLIGDAIMTGAQYLRVTEVSASAGGSYSMLGDESTFLTYFNWSGGNGTFNVNIPDAFSNKGRFLRFMSDGTFTTGNTTVNLVASGSQSIDGSPEYPFSKDYNGLGILSTGQEWVVIQLKG